MASPVPSTHPIFIPWAANYGHVTIYFFIMSSILSATTEEGWSWATDSTLPILGDSLQRTTFRGPSWSEATGVQAKLGKHTQPEKKPDFIKMTRLQIWHDQYLEHKRIIIHLCIGEVLSSFAWKVWKKTILPLFKLMGRWKLFSLHSMKTFIDLLKTLIVNFIPNLFFKIQNSN